MAKVTIWRSSVDAGGVVYSVRDDASGTISSYRPDVVKPLVATLPSIGVTPKRATTVPLPVRCWQLDAPLQITDPMGAIIQQGFKGDYLIETPEGELTVVRQEDFRSFFDIEGTVKRVFYETVSETFGAEESVRTYDKALKEV